MLSVKEFLFSSIGKKYVMAASGLSLVGFVIVHLLGNLSLYFPDGRVFNSYAHGLVSLGALLNVAEAGLLVLFGLHFVLGLSLKIANRSARPLGYHASPASKGGDNRNSLSARIMAVTGVVLLAFLVLHVWQFRLGPGLEQGYRMVVGDHEVRDLYRLVREVFENPLFAGIYVVSMLTLGLHLRHGIWSAFQSFGVLSDRNSSAMYRAALVLSVFLTLGFLGIPLWLFFHVPALLGNSF